MLVVVLAVAFRRAAPGWAGGGRLAVLVVTAVVAGAAVPLALGNRPEEHPAAWDDDTLTGLAARLAAADLDDRGAALDQLSHLAEHTPGRVPAIVELVSGFLREHTPRAGDPGCAGSAPEDVAAAVTVLRGRKLPADTDVVLDLRGRASRAPTCAPSPRPAAGSRARTCPARGCGAPT